MSNGTTDDAEEWDATRIKAIREREGLSQMELANELGVSKSSVEFWEMGHRRPNELNRRKLRIMEQSGSDKWLAATSLRDAVRELYDEAASTNGSPADEWYARQLEAILERHDNDSESNDRQ